MTELMPIYLRAHTTFSEPERRWRGHRKRWDRFPDFALIFDCETTLNTSTQSLTFGSYAVCRRERNGEYVCIEEGLFFADGASEKERRIIQEYSKLNKSQAVRGYPSTIRVMSRNVFVGKVLLRLAFDGGAMICGFNLPFDLSRLAVEARAARNRKGWSLILSEYKDKNTGELKENRFRPRIVITPKDSKAAFIHLTGTVERKNIPGCFLDVRTFVWALRNESHSLESACKAFGIKGKLKHKLTGRITPEEIAYCRQDTQATLRLLNAVSIEFLKHPLKKLLPERAISPASIGKAYLLEMGIRPPLEKFSVSDEVMGIGMEAYYGGRAECRNRHTPLPVAVVDFTSQYPTVNTLMGLFKYLTAETLEIVDATDEIKRFCGGVTLERTFDPQLWKELCWFALIKPDSDIFPVRTTYDGNSYNIGINCLSSEKPIWFSGPDVVASILQTGKVPQILRAIRLKPQGQQNRLSPVRFQGQVYVDPRRQDFFKNVVEARAQAKKMGNESLAYFLKILANATSYGLFVEVNPERKGEREQVQVFSGNDSFSCSTPIIEKKGPWYFPPLGALITAAGRLLLTMLERTVADAGGTYLFADTDSMGIVSNPEGGYVHCKGGPHKLLENGLEVVRALSFEDIRKIVQKFERLNPYNRRFVQQILKIEKMEAGLYGYAISTKRYALYSRTSDGLRIEKVSEHGLGYLCPPKGGFNKRVKSPQWIVDFWEYLLRRAESLPAKAPSFFRKPAMLRMAVTTPQVLRPLQRLQKGLPYELRTKPYGFVLSPILNRFMEAARTEPITLITPFTKDLRKLHRQKFVNIHNGEIFDTPPIPVETFADVFEEFCLHPENKSTAPDGGMCEPKTEGLLRRRAINAGWVVRHGKETDRKWEQGDDISLLFPLLPEYHPDETDKMIRDAGLQQSSRQVPQRMLAAEANVSTRTVRAARKGKRLRKQTVLKLQNALNRIEEARIMAANSKSNAVAVSL